jgi:hypothetical protein
MRPRNVKILAIACLIALTISAKSAVSPVLFEFDNDFLRDFRSDLPKAGKSSIAVFNGGLKYEYNDPEKPGNSSYFGLFQASFFSENIRISCNLTLLGDSPTKHFGLIFGGPDTSFDTLWAFLISGDQNYMIISPNSADKGGSGVLESRFTKAVQPSIKGTNNLRIEIFADRIEFYINDNFISKIFTKEPVRGFIGLYLNEPGLSVLFQRLSVERLDSK